MVRHLIAASVAVLIGAAGGAFAENSALSGGRGDGVLPLGETEAVDGVVPLRLPSDGVLPLRLSGRASSMTGTQNLATEVVITRAARESMPLNQAGSLVCQQPENKVSKHIAAGTVTVGATTYAIKGICYDK